MRAKRYAYCDDRHSTMTTVEVITSVERRRRWSREEKLRIVAESAQPSRTTSQVARDHGIAPGQLFIWRRQLLSEAMHTPSKSAPEDVPRTIGRRSGRSAIAWTISSSERAAGEPQARSINALAAAPCHAPPGCPVAG